MVVELGTRLGDMVANAKYENLTEDNIIAAKQSIMDTLGVMLAGSGVGECTENVADLLDDMGGTDDCTVICRNKRSNPVFAVMANGALAHSIDYDDVHDDAFVHPSGSIIPTVLTLGEYTHASGKDLITAVAVGNDVICRMGFATCNSKKKDAILWMTPVMLGTFSATAAASKLLGLDAVQTKNAMGISFNRALGTKQLINEAGALRGLYCMFPNTTGTLAALLARKGVPGFDEPFNGSAGFWHMVWEDEFDEEPFETLGKEYWNDGISTKPWPACRFTNSHINAALNIAKAHEIDPDKVKKITLFYESSEAARCLFPEDERKNPPSIPGAKISTPFTVALALTTQKVEISSFTAESIKDPILLGLTNKCVYEKDETLVSDISKTMLPGRVAIEMEDGTVYDERVDVIYGHPLNRMSWEDMTAKFRDCASYAKRHFSEVEIMHISEVIEHLEDLEDAGELLALLS